jgi:heptosyltransferase-3
MRWLDRYLGIPLVAVGSTTRGRHEMPAHPQSFGVLNTAAIGDTVLMSGPILDLRAAFPNASIILFVGPSNYEAAQLIPGVDSVIFLPIPNVYCAVKVLRERGLDVLLDFGPWPRINALLALLARAAFTIGFQTAREYRHYGYDLSIEHSARVHELENYRRIVRALGVPTRNGISLECRAFPNPTWLPASYVVLHLWAGGSGARFKEWPIDRWILLAQMLASEGYDVVFTGANGDLESNRIAISRIPDPERERMVNAAGLSLAETAAVLARARMVVSVNTGVMHLAAAYETPLVALHGPTSPLRWGPVSGNSVVVKSPLSESGYLHLGFEFPRRPPKCMEAITYDAVWQACSASLNDSPRRAPIGSHV